jgi:hypothetical protein
MNEHYLLFVLIIVLGLVQSFMGVGILLFGTPTLLLLGYTYTETLAFILPSSILISALQTYGGLNYLTKKKSVLIYTLPALIVALTLVIYMELSLNLKQIVGSALILVGLIRFSSVFKEFLNIFILKNEYIYCMIMGIVHGISNMGGGMLVLLMGSKHKDHKIFRVNVAFVYLVFGIIQFFILSLLSFDSITTFGFVLALAAGPTYLISIRFFKKYIDVHDQSCQYFITFFIFLYGIISFL